MSGPTAQDIEECVVSGWGAADVAEEFGISVERAEELLRRRDALRRAEMTPQDVVDGLRVHRTLTAWAAAQGVFKTGLLTRISSWRKLQTKAQLDDLRAQLRRCELSEHTIKAICGREPGETTLDARDLLRKYRAARSVEMPPAVSRAELAQDAEFIGRWGHV